MTSIRNPWNGWRQGQTFISILLKNLRSSFESLRTNGGAGEIIGDFPFMLSLVEAFIGFFSRITILSICGEFRRKRRARLENFAPQILTLRLTPRPWPVASAQDSAPRASWKVPWACAWGSTCAGSPAQSGQSNFLPSRFHILRILKTSKRLSIDDNCVVAQLRNYAIIRSRSRINNRVPESDARLAYVAQLQDGC